MADPLQLSVDNTSPTISYYPFADTFGAPNLNAGWNPYFSDSGYAAFQGQQGAGNSTHRTSLDGASFSVQWNGTGIQLFGNASQASYILTLDGTTVHSNSSSLEDGVLADLYGLPDANHTLRLTVQTSSSPSPDTFLDFDTALLTFSSERDDNNSTLLTQTMNDTAIAFLGQWSYKSAIAENGQNLSFHYSVSTGDRFEINFQARAISITGFVSDVSGRYSVTFDNQTTTWSGKSSFFYPYAMLFHATEIDDSRQHQLVVENMEDRILALMVGGVNYTSAQQTGRHSVPANSNTGTQSGTRAAIALACVLTFVLFAGVFFYYLVYKPRVRRQAYDRKVQRRREKEVGDIVDISAAAEGGASRRSSSRTSARLAGLLFGMAKQQSKSDIVHVDSDDSRHGSKRGSHTSEDFHRQWETHTIDLPPTSSHNASRRPSTQRPDQRSRHTLMPSPQPRPSSDAHTRRGSDARLLGDQRAHANDDADARSIRTTDSDYNYAAEIALSPRTSVAQYVGGVRTSTQTEAANPATSQLWHMRWSREPPHLDIMEESPYAVDFVGLSGRGGGKDLRNSRLSQIRLQDPGTKPEQQSSPQDVKRLSQVRFDTSARPLPNPRTSFFDFASTPPSSNNSNSDVSSSSNQTVLEKSRWSATTVPSQGASPSRTVTSPASASFNVPPTTPPPQARPQGPRFPSRLSTSSSPPNRLTFGMGPFPGPSTLQPLSPAVTSPDHYAEPTSPSDSIPRSVSEIHFRPMSTEAGSLRTSTGSQLLPHPPLPSSLQPLPETPTAPFIVQKLLGMNTSSGPLSSRLEPPPPPPSQDVTPPTSAPPTPPPPTMEPPIPEYLGPAHRESGSEPSTPPFMQRVFGIGSSVLIPRNNRNQGQEVTKSAPESSSSGRPRPHDK